MKKFFIIAVVMLTALASIVVSCKKDDTPANPTAKETSKNLYQPPQVDDMDAYLKAFKQKMQTRGNDETMDLDEAAWHLSSVANYDFGDVVDDFAYFHYDTLHYNINVVNGKVNVSDLNALYTVAASDIESTYENLDLDNKHIRFIGADISGDGMVKMSIIVSFGWMDHQWYFPDSYILYVTLSQFYSEDSTYSTTNEYFRNKIEEVLNIMMGHSTNPNQRLYYVYTRSLSFRYDYYYDPYTYINIQSSRIFARTGLPSFLTFDEMCYLTDSYAGLGNSHKTVDEEVIDWSISDIQIDYDHYGIVHHIPTVNYGVLCGTDTPPINPQD